MLLWTSPGWGGCGVERSPTWTLRQDLGGGQEAGNPSKFGAECGVPSTDPRLSRVDGLARCTAWLGVSGRSGWAGWVTPFGALSLWEESGPAPG